MFVRGAGRSSNGRTAAFEAVNLGSIPSLPAPRINERQASLEAQYLGSIPSPPAQGAIGTINFLELSDQKPDNSQRDGFDHIEAYAVGRSHAEMVKEL